MKSKRIALAMVGLVVLFMLGFLLSKPTHASSPTSPTQVQVVNKPTVTVGNTPTVQVANTPSVNVANEVAISSLPAFFSYSDLYPVQAQGFCSFAAGSTQCTVDNIYTVPDGFYAVLTDINGMCFTGVVPVGTAQLLLQWGGVPDTVNFPVSQDLNSNALINPATFGFSGMKFRSDAGSTITGLVTDTSTPPDGSNCTYLVGGYLVPTAVAQSSASFPGRGNLKSYRRR